MGSLIDLIGSFVIGGLLLMMILSFNSNFYQLTTEDQMKLIVQQNLNELVSIVEYDFRKIGYGVQNPTLSIIRADSSSIAFWADLDNNGVVDSVIYRLTSANGTPGTANPRDRVLYRKVNTQAVGGTAGVVQFLLTLYDVSGAVTTNTTLVKSIKYSLRVENPFPVDTVYARSTWNGVIRPKNL
jgi:lipopolysaccharide export LptBFGC system permease protein LptF